jgi:hypothetical protein
MPLISALSGTMESAFWGRIIADHGVAAVTLFWLSRPSVCMSLFCDHILCTKHKDVQSKGPKVKGSKVVSANGVGSDASIDYVTSI